MCWVTLFVVLKANPTYEADHMGSRFLPEVFPEIFYA